jgi:caffeoyl-CoA O-methyltransferase
VNLWRHLRNLLQPSFRRPDLRYVAGEYAERLSEPLPPLLLELTEETYALEGRRADMISGRVQGGFLQMMVALSSARRVLELGTYTGFTALMMTAALPPDGELVTCEVDSRRATVAQKYFDRSPHRTRIRLAVQPAQQLLAGLDPGFDLIFVDIGTAAAAVYEQCLALLAPKGVLLIDNVLARGAVLDGRTDRARAVAALNERIAADKRVTQVMLTVRDGLTLIRRKRADE